MRKQPYIYRGAVEGVFALLASPKWNISEDFLMREAGVLPQDVYIDEHRADLSAFASILETAAKITQNNGLVFEIMASIEQYAGSLVHYAFRQSPTVQVALQIGIRYAGLIISFKKLDFDQTDDEAFFRWTNFDTYEEFPQFQVWTPARVVTMLRAALGKDWCPSEVSLIYDTPANLDDYQKMFGVDVKFKQKENFIKLTKDELQCTMPARDEQLWQGLLALSDKLITELSPEPAIINSVRKHILNSLPEDQANVRHISSLMAKSPRTLQRELNAAGTSFSVLLEEIRRGMADKYLSDTTLHISQIAFLLGFSEVSVFTRAVNRWFGKTPSAYRKQLQVRRKA